MVFKLLLVMMTAKQKVIKALHLDKLASCIYPAVHVQHYPLTLWKDSLLTEMHE